MTSDRTSFQRVARTEGAKLGEVARKAARQAHTQGVVLPILIAGRDTGGLAAVASDKALNEPTRLGAIEGLAALGLDEAEKALRGIGTSAKDDEEIRKAAWRGLRRSKRARAKAKVTP